MPSILKDFVYSLSDTSLYRRFLSARKDMPHERLQEFVVIDYTRETAIVAMVGKEDNEEIAAENQPMLHMFGNGGFDIVKHNISGIYEMTLAFKDNQTNDD